MNRIALLLILLASAWRGMAQSEKELIIHFSKWDPIKDPLSCKASLKKMYPSRHDSSRIIVYYYTCDGELCGKLVVRHHEWKKLREYKQGRVVKKGHWNKNGRFRSKRRVWFCFWKPVRGHRF
jgi:hypothetical protein